MSLPYGLAERPTEVTYGKRQEQCLVPSRCYLTICTCYNERSMPLHIPIPVMKVKEETSRLSRQRWGQVASR